MRLSKEKKEKISEQILSYLYHSFPKQPFTAEIARELARDEEFTKKLLFDLKERKFITSINRGKNNIVFTRRLKWTLVPKVYDIYRAKEIL